MMEKVYTQTEFLQQLMQLMPGGFFCYDAENKQEFAFISDSTPQMFGYTMEQFQSKFNNCFPEMIYIEDRDRVQKEIADQIQKGNSDYCVYRVEMADGSLKWVYDRGQLIEDEHGKKWFSVMVLDADEITTAEQQRKEQDRILLEKLRNQTEWSMVTGILNYPVAVTYIEKAIKKYKGGTLFFLDIDNFNSINTLKGHPYADQLLKEIAISARKLIHPEEILSRLEGDKFIIFLPGNYQQKTAERRAAEIIEDMRDLMSHDIDNGGCSIGISISNNPDTTFDEMLLQAGKMLNEAKATGKRKYCTIVMK